ncbi:CRISPR-associated endonuclease Cas2 [Haloarcula sp. S1CR25-12]|uniref:CRISPR-associated endoribonuclease Cas2 n=1 Tax=Haloarcula saliterrae TaxID=2950534 RepID=A0ABU2FE76_9EURY|nr:CRISPR-associated endonuclease Cas2 [Haloarcula sp. S1CR25-12]MDS0260549.1 CRISPR-associated endonuclease Cas2 [Haloarcula sp. S1CR25-12]
MRLVVTYDVSDDANRRQVYRTLERYGAWRQYSVFEVDVSKAERVELEDELEDQIDESDGDRVRIYRQCDSCLDHITDLGSDPPEEQSNVI